DKQARLIKAGLQLPVEVAGHSKNHTLPAMNPLFWTEFRIWQTACGIGTRNAFGLNRLETMTGALRPLVSPLICRLPVQPCAESSGSLGMPRYFFDVIDGHRLPDPAGL